MEREPPYTDGKIEVIPAAGPLGAEVRGVDLSSDIDRPSLAAIERAWARHLVLEWHDQPLTVAQHIAFGRRLGQLEDMSHVDQPETGLPPEVLVIVNDPALNDAVAPPAGYLKGFQNKHVQWHSDNSYREVPPKGSLFAVKESPPEGGVTIFSNMYAAYETLDPEMKQKIAGRELIHDPSLNSANVLREGVTPPTDVSRGQGRAIHWYASIRSQVEAPSISAAGLTPMFAVMAWRKAKRSSMRFGRTPRPTASFGNATSTGQAISCCGTTGAPYMPVRPSHHLRRVWPIGCRSRVSR